jgi:biotin transport system substrate-specific component
MQSTNPAQSGLLHPSVSNLQSTRESLQQSMTGKVMLVVAATVFVAACAHISVPLPFTPVPITLQNFAVLLVGMVLGPVAGFSAMVLYLAEGALGLPVFTPHSLGGVAHLLGPNAGYLFSYPLAAAVAGWVVRAMQRITSRFRSAIVASIVASLPIFAIGAAWLGHLLHLSLFATWTLAVAPFLLGEVIKITAAAGIFSALQRWQRS